MSLRRPCLGISADSPLCHRLTPPGRPRCDECARARAQTIHTRDDQYDRNRLSIIAEAGTKCPRCATAYTTTNPITVEHVHPLEAGGTNDLANLAPLCKRCNSQLGSKLNRKQRPK